MAQAREIHAVRSNFGIWARATHTVLRFQGADAATWLHAQTTNDVKGLQSGQGNIQALLDRTGRVLTFFTLHRWEDEYWLILPKDDVAAVEARIESHLFLEDVKMENVGGDARQISVEGPKAYLFFDAIMAGGKLTSARSLPVAPNSFAPVRILGKDLLAFRLSESGEDGFLFIPAPGEDAALLEALLEHALEFGAGEISPEAVDVLRIEAGQPRNTRDIDATTVINETPLEQSAVSYEKGCYLGQEVVARLKTYGTPKQALTGIIASDPGALLPPSGAPLLHDGKRVGLMRSSAYSPTLDAWIALAYLDRAHRVPGTLLALHDGSGGEVFQARVVALPFVHGKDRLAVAHALYDDALALFEADANDESDAPVDALKQAIVLAPDFEDAYEVLGVILHRRHRVDEAIHYMKALARLNPNCVMAHTNLSVFYVSKGMITEAENEKALARQLEFQMELNAREAEKAAQAERARIRAEAEERIGMFHEVLEFDPEDAVAAMGLGSAYMQLERYQDALPHLARAALLKKDYSAAFLSLGKCHEFVGQADEAKTAYREGIAAASRKGDLMPLREMERRLRALEGESAQ